MTLLSKSSFLLPYNTSIIESLHMPFALSQSTYPSLIIVPYSAFSTDIIFPSNGSTSEIVPVYFTVTLSPLATLSSPSGFSSKVKLYGVSLSSVTTNMKSFISSIVPVSSFSSCEPFSPSSLVSACFALSVPAALSCFVSLCPQPANKPVRALQDTIFQTIR